MWLVFFFCFVKFGQLVRTVSVFQYEILEQSLLLEKKISLLAKAISPKKRILLGCMFDLFDNITCRLDPKERESAMMMMICLEVLPGLTSF